MTAARIQPFDTSGIERGADGICRYLKRPPSLVEMLRLSVDRDPDAEAIVELGGRRLSYRQLWEGAARVAGGLRAAGVKSRDRVAIHLPNGVDWVLAFFGAQMADAIAVPLNIRFTPKEIAYVVEDSGSCFVVEPGRPLPDGDPLVSETAEPASVAALFYTSGTTGFPKGAMMTHGNFVSNTENVRRAMGVGPWTPDLRSLLCVPLFHVTGCNAQLLVTLEQGGSAVIMPQFTPQAFLHAIPEERINSLIAVPAIYWLAVEQPNFSEFDASGVRWLTYGGAPIAPAVVHRLREKFPTARLSNGYGLTETSSLVIFLPHQYAIEHADSVGFPVPVDDLDLLEPDPVSGVGELLIRGPNVVAGYWNKPEATAESFVNGWFHTGDMARIDQMGLTYIVDRKKDMIVRGGENVYCVEVESALVGHPSVFEVAVVGVPDVVMGEKVGAVIVPVAGRKIDPREIVAFAREHLADFKVPQYVVVSEAPLPRNANGKVLKNQLRDKTDWGSALGR